MNADDASRALTRIEVLGWRAHHIKSRQAAVAGLLDIRLEDVLAVLNQEGDELRAIGLECACLERELAQPIDPIPPEPIVVDDGFGSVEVTMLDLRDDPPDPPAQPATLPPPQPWPKPSPVMAPLPWEPFKLRRWLRRRLKGVVKP